MLAARLGVEDQRLLFALARDAIRRHLERLAPPALPGGRPALDEVRGVFVTLHRGDELRGCIGHAIGRLPLAEAVRELAVSAAARDRRFAPVARAELDELTVELSVLSALAPIRPEEVQVGRHGLVVRDEGRAGLLLPQVASERGWAAAEFLEHTCRKAGLPPDAWRRTGAELLAFTCDLFIEAPPPRVVGA